MSTLRDAFDLLVDLSEGERELRLADLGLSPREIESLRVMLRSDASGKQATDRPVESLLESLRNDNPPPSLVGSAIGSFRLVESVGEGGQALVFRGEREVGAGRQVAAIKIMRRDIYSPSAERRFRREQAILAQLDHPNIARLIEGGLTETGLPYIAMEYVDGSDLVAHAKEKQLDIPERLQLFSKVCLAVDAAHSALVIHRDLKPSNVMVNGSGEVKILDFGIARDIERKDITETISLTPEYAAPEQFTRSLPTVAIDVFSLGVILGELLTGVRSREQVPSRAVSASPDVRGPKSRKYRRALKGDLDAIFSKATAPAPAERYRSASELALDVERFLNGAPVIARRWTKRYRASKFIRRNVIGLALVGFAAALLVASVFITLREARRAEAARLVAVDEASRADSMRSVILEAFTNVESETGRGEVTVREAVENAVSSLQEKKELDARARLDLLTSLADALGREGNATKARATLGEVSLESAALYGEKDELTLRAEERLAKFEIQQSDFGLARKRLDRLLALGLDQSRPVYAKILEQSASASSHLGDFERGISDGRAAVAASQILGDRELELGVRASFGNILLMANRLEEAVVLYSEVRDIAVELHGPAHEQVSLAYTGMARAYRRLGFYELAERSARAALEIDRKVYKGDHWDVANHLNALTLTLIAQRKLDEALLTAREGQEIADRILDDDHPDKYFSTLQVGAVLSQLERFDEALPYLQRTVERRSALLGEAAYDTAIARSQLGLAEGVVQSARKGMASIDQAIADLRAKAPGDRDGIARALERKVQLAIHRGDYPTGESAIADLASETQDMKGTDGLWWAGRALTWRADLLLRTGEPEHALRILDYLGDQRDVALSTNPLQPVHAAILRASALKQLRQPEASIAAEEARRLLAQTRWPPAALVEMAKQL